MDTRGGPQARQHIGGRLVGLRPARPSPPGCAARGGAPSLAGNDPLGHRLCLEADAARRVAAHPLAAGARRLPRHAPHRRGRGVAGLDDRLVAHRQPGPVGRPLRPGAASARRRRPSTAAAAAAHGVASSAPCAEVAASLGLPAGVRVVTGLPDLHSAGARRPARSTTWRAAPGAHHHVVDLVPRHHKKTDVIRPIATVPGIAAGPLPGRQQPRDVGRAACTGCASRRRPRRPLGYDELDDPGRRSAAPGPAACHVHAVAGGRAHARSPTARPAPASTTCRLPTSRADLVRAVLEGVAYNDRWLHEAVEKFAGGGSTPIRIIGGGARSDLWCQIHADVMDRTIEQVGRAARRQPARRRARSPRSRSARVRTDELRASCRCGRRSAPTRPTGRVYDRLYAEFPGLYSPPEEDVRPPQRPQARLTTVAGGPADARASPPPPSHP